MINNALKLHCNSTGHPENIWIGILSPRQIKL